MKLMNYIKNWNKIRILKRALNDMDRKDIYTLTETKYGEAVLIGILENDKSELTIQLLYAGLNKIYRATFLGNYNGTEMIIADIKVLKQPSYSPKNNEPFGKGYGTLLMTIAVKEARRRGITHFIGDRVATSREQYERQENFYSKLGFSITEEEKLYKVL